MFRCCRNLVLAAIIAILKLPLLFTDALGWESASMIQRLDILKYAQNSANESIRTYQGDFS